MAGLLTIMSSLPKSAAIRSTMDLTAGPSVTSARGALTVSSVDFRHNRIDRGAIRQAVDRNLRANLCQLQSDFTSDIFAGASYQLNLTGQRLAANAAVCRFCHDVLIGLRHARQGNGGR